MNNTPPKSASSPPPVAPEASANPPALAESLVVLGLLAIVAISCGMLYGPMIRQMFIAMIR